METNYDKNTHFERREMQVYYYKFLISDMKGYNLKVDFERL